MIINLMVSLEFLHRGHDSLVTCNRAYTINSHMNGKSIHSQAREMLNNASELCEWQVMKKSLLCQFSMQMIE
jgi:hypothetical protein